MTRARPSQLAMTGLVIAVVGVAMRVNNAFQYPVRWGFDAKFNWIYIERLLSSWALPTPDESWATSHPPFFYYLAAALVRALGHPDIDTSVIAIRLVSTAAGLGMVVLAVLLVRRVDPQNPWRALVAGGLLLFLPAHIYMSAMLNEEILAATFTSLALVGASLALASPTPPRRQLLRAAGIGCAAGLALLTKLSGLLVVLASAAAYAFSGLRRREVSPTLGRIVTLLVVVTLVGGWYYANNQIRYGYLYPQHLSTHEIMFTMPPGERSIGDYVYVPLATWKDPQLLSPDLLNSVWGSTYVTLWFDGHRTFLPKNDVAVHRIGTLILLLGLLPTLGFAIGLVRGTRRALASARNPDAPLVILVVLTLAGYVFFTWRNPWFAAVKGTYLLGISVPFAYYASETLTGWMRKSGAVSRLVLVTLIALGLAVSVTFTYGPVFAKWGEIPGLEWRQ